MESGRTVVVSGVPKVLPDSRMVDKLTIHFQSPRRSHGGDVEEVAFPTTTDGVAFVTFTSAEDAERVVKKERHIFTDDEFHENYHLTVFPFSRDVFLYVPSATLDLSPLSSHQASLVDDLRSAHRSIRFTSCPQQRTASIEGPFSAVKALRADLIQRASRLQAPPQNAAPQGPKAQSRRDESGCTSSRVRHVVGQEAQDRDVSSPSSPTKSGRISPATEPGGGQVTSPHHWEDPSSSRMRDDVHGLLSRDFENIWLDSYTFRYIQRFQRRELDGCLGDLDVSITSVKGSGLVRLSLTEKQPTKATLRILEDTLKNLQTLMEFWRSGLRVYEIRYSETDRQKLALICRDVNSRFHDVLCLYEDSAVKIIGPPEKSHLFYKKVKDKMASL